MPKEIASISVSGFTKDNLNKGLMKIIGNGITGQTFPFLEQKIKAVMVERLTHVLSESEVLNALIGGQAGDEEGNDLQAEYGLTDDLANGAIRSIVDVLASEDSIMVDFNGVSANSNDALKIKFSVNWLRPDYEEQLINIPEGKYTSVTKIGVGNRQRTRRTVIPWMYWMMRPLVGSFEDDFGITYEDPTGTSRSTRAIMTKDRGDNFPYELPIILVRPHGKDWVLGELNSQNFRQVAKAAIEQVVSTNITKYIQQTSLKFRFPSS